MTPRFSSLSVKFWSQMLAAIFTVLLLVVWEHVEALRLDRKLRPMRKEVDRLMYENSRLQMQINQWVTTGHLDTIAKKEMNMGPVDSAHWIGIEK